MKPNGIVILFMVVSVSGGSPVIAQKGGAFSITESGRHFQRLADAIGALGNADGTIVVAPGRYSDCAVLKSGSVTIRAEVASSAIFDGGVCEGKATLVLRGANATVDGLVFQNIKVPDRNGAGIRIERGNLHVIRSTFRDSEQGILAAEDPASAISIERSTFSGLGGCPGGMCSHSIYVGGHYGSLTVSRVRFERGAGGHYVKSRSANISITDSSFDDSNGHETNYMVDLPEGATGTIARNMFVQGKDKENHSALIAISAEGRTHPSAGLEIVGNDAALAPSVPWSTVFIADWSRQTLKIGPNKLGPGLRLSETR